MKVRMTPTVEVVKVRRGEVTLQVKMTDVSVSEAPAGIAHVGAVGPSDFPITLSEGNSLALPVEWDITV